LKALRAKTASDKEQETRPKREEPKRNNN
jgi:hypothetical protein